MKDVKQLYEKTQLTLEQIAEATGKTYAQVHYYVSKHYSKSAQQTRKVANYRNSKLGNKNPMKGKTRELHHNYIGEVSDGKGYIMTLKPDWYEGRKGCKHVFVHHIVMCEALGLKCIPKGWHVHHVNKDKTNNSLTNLALCVAGAHMKLHQLERATTSRKA
jgi:hypothetical protein